MLIIEDISEGENVKVYNDRGDFHGNARISEDVSPGIVVATLGYWRQKSKTGTVNSISSGITCRYGECTNIF